MDIQKDFSNLERNARIFCKNVDVENDFQEALPAYCDDIFRVVKCSAKSSVVSADINYNEIKVVGKTEICLTYYNESSDLCYADFEEEFTKTVNAENLTDSAFIMTNMGDKYTNFRVINQRRIDVHVSGNLHMEVYDTVKSPYLCACSQSKLKTEIIKSADIIRAENTRIEFDEEFSLPADSKPIKRIISACANAAVNETKIIKDKALIKGIVSLSMLYTADDSETLLKGEYSFPVSKIIEINGIEENDIAISEWKIASIYVKAKTSAGESLNVLDAFGEVGVSTVFIRETESEIVTDGYFLQHISACTYADCACLSNGRHWQECRLMSVSVDLPADVAEMKELCVQIGHAEAKKGKLIAPLSVSAICVKTDGDVIAFHSEKELEVPIEAYENAMAAISLQSFDYTLQQNTRVDIRLNTDINAYLYDDKTLRVLSDLEPQEALAAAPTLTVYFATAQESVWNIAKMFSSDAALIMRENELTADILDGNQVLIIPRA